MIALSLFYLTFDSGFFPCSARSLAVLFHSPVFLTRMPADTGQHVGPRRPATDGPEWGMKEGGEKAFTWGSNIAMQSQA